MRILTESKQSIINLGFPSVIVDILFDEFGKNAFLIARWYKEYTTSHVYSEDKLWWRKILHGLTRIGVVQFVDVYEASEQYMSGALSIEQYNKVRDRADMMDIQPGKEVDLYSLKSYIAEEFFKEAFFDRNLIKAIKDGSLRDLKPYSSLPYHQASEKYEKKSVFKDKAPVKVYANGWKWVDAGKKCDIIGKDMKNCGSTGVMSTDKDRTMMTLVNKANKPHVVATYSRSENRISGVEGQASTAIKDEYADYVIDLANTLQARIDTDSSTGSKYLKLKSIFKTEVERVPGKSPFEEFFLIKMPNGLSYYSDGYQTFPANDFEKVILPRERANLFDKLTVLFGHNFRDDIIDQNGWAASKFKRIIQLDPASSLATEAIQKFIMETLRRELRSFKHRR